MFSLLIQGPIVSSKNNFDFDCTPYIQAYCNDFSGIADLIVISTWPCPQALKLKEDFANSPNIVVLLCSPPNKKPFINFDTNPSKNMYLRDTTSFVGLEFILNRSIPYTLRVRTDQYFTNLKEIKSFDLEDNITDSMLYVKSFRTTNPYMFSDCVFLSSTLLMHSFFCDKLKLRQLYLNVHHDDFFRLYLLVSKSLSPQSIFLPYEFFLNFGILNQATINAICHLWLYHISPLPSQLVTPLLWRGVSHDITSETNETFLENFNPFTLHETLAKTTTFPDSLVKDYFLCFTSTFLSKVLYSIRICLYYVVVNINLILSRLKSFLRSIRF